MGFADKMKRAIKSQINQMQLCDVVMGVVTNKSPLMIEIDQRYILPPTPDAALSSQIFVLSRNVTEHKIEMTVDHKTEDETEHIHPMGGGATTHRHDYKGRKVFIVHKGLEVGERVIMVKRKGSQKYYILDRVGEA